MSVSTLIDMFMRNTHHALENRYNELKLCKLTWGQFLIEVTVINDEESRWDTFKNKKRKKGSVVLPRTIIIIARSGTMGFLHVLRT